MKKIAIVLSIIVIFAFWAGTQFLYTLADDKKTVPASLITAEPEPKKPPTTPELEPENVSTTPDSPKEIAEPDSIANGEYEIYTDGNLKKRLNDFDEAVAYASQFEKTSIMRTGKSKWLWDNYPPFNVFTSNDHFEEFNSFAEATNYARSKTHATIYHRKDNSLIWSNIDTLPDHKMILNTPSIMQLPELPRGCEVTSLAMLMNYKGLESTKNQLAEEIKKDTTPYQVKNGKIYYGNPNNGFIGDMTSFNTLGLGVYHKPIFELLVKHLSDSAIDLTGCEFEDLLQLVNTNAPVWIIINSTYAKLPNSNFVIWNTPDGEIKVTNKEHSVLITGYDEKSIYFNDPLSGKTLANKQKFKEAWEQMGRQAISVSH